MSNKVIAVKTPQEWIEIRDRDYPNYTSLSKSDAKTYEKIPALSVNSLRWGSRNLKPSDKKMLIDGYIPGWRLADIIEYDANLKKIAKEGGSKKKSNNNNDEAATSSEPEKGEKSEVETEAEEDDEEGEESDEEETVKWSKKMEKYKGLNKITKGAKIDSVVFRNKSLSTDVIRLFTKRTDFVIKDYNLTMDESVLDTLSNIDSGLLSMFAYLGFDPKLIFSIIVARADLHKRNWKVDVRMLFHYILVRGTTLTDKAINNSSAEAKEELLALQQVYGIAHNINSVPTHNKRVAITLARVVATFPYHFAKMIAKNANNKQIRILNWKENSPIPIYLMFPAAASLIPKSNTALIAAFNTWSVGFGDIVRSGDASWTGMTSEEKLIEVQKWTAIAQGSNLFDEERRSGILAKLAIDSSSAPKQN